ncbi:MAG: hypothetical protein LBP26_02625 [Clostridiales bacterium]|jgi:hypothetical protein|nr:hypothetical protein [Clostridiales bacterium]
MPYNDYIAPVSESVRTAAVRDFSGGFDNRVDEGVHGLARAKTVINFEFSSGALTDGYGAEEFLGAEAAVTSLWLYRKFDSVLGRDVEAQMYSTAAGAVMYRVGGAGEFVPLSGVTLGGPPYVTNYRLYGEDVILICDPLGGMHVWNMADPPYKIDSAPTFTGITMHFERMFATGGAENNTVWFTDDLDPTNWNPASDEGGFIQMLDGRGHSNRVVSFLNYVYVFRDYGITRITAYADQSEFAATNLFVSSGKIYPGSVTDCGAAVMFLASDGVYKFDGLSTQKTLGAVSPSVLPSPSASGAYFDGKYYLALNVDRQEMSGASGNGNGGSGNGSGNGGGNGGTSGNGGNGNGNGNGGNGNGNGANGSGNNSVLVYDLKSGAYSFMQGPPVSRLCVLGDALYAVTADGRAAKIVRSGTLFGVPSVKEFDSGLYDYGTHALKYFRAAVMESNCPLAVTVYTERRSRTRSLTPKNGVCRVKIGLSGRRFGFRIVCESSSVRIARAYIEYTVRGGK